MVALRGEGGEGVHGEGGEGVHGEGGEGGRGEGGEGVHGDAWRRETPTLSHTLQPVAIMICRAGSGGVDTYDSKIEEESGKCG